MLGVGGAVTMQHGMAPGGACCAGSASPWQHEALGDSGTVWHFGAASPEPEASPTTTQWLLASRKLNSITAARGTRRQWNDFNDRIVICIFGLSAPDIDIEP